MGGSVEHGLKDHEIGEVETKKDTELSERVEVRSRAEQGQGQEQGWGL